MDAMGGESRGTWLELKAEDDEKEVSAKPAAMSGLLLGANRERHRW